MHREDDEFETLGTPASSPSPLKNEKGSGLARSGLARSGSTGDDLNSPGYTRSSTSKAGLAGSGAGKRAQRGQGLSLKARAIGYLSRREHSRLELQRKLAPYAPEAEELEQLLDQLERENWLSNERFAHSMVHRLSARQGASLVMQELKRHGLQEATISDLGQQLKETEFQRAEAVWQKKFGAAPGTPKDYARQFRFLASRGFSSDCVRRILGAVPYGNE